MSTDVPVIDLLNQRKVLRALMGVIESEKAE
jgi:hypothetical protein